MKTPKIKDKIKWETYDNEGNLSILHGRVTVVYRKSVTIEWNRNPMGLDKTYNVSMSVFDIENGDWSIEG